MNLRPSNCYRSYDKSIPEWLHNRPKNYVKHCLEKMELTKEINTRNLFKSEELQKFNKSREVLRGIFRRLFKNTKPSVH